MIFLQAEEHKPKQLLNLNKDNKTLIDFKVKILFNNNNYNHHKNPNNAKSAVNAIVKQMHLRNQYMKNKRILMYMSHN